jgi:hypothetical protein
MSIIGQLMDAGGLFNLPDTFPIPSRDELREILESSVRTEKPEHLEEWTQITGKGNPAKNKIERFSRLFELRHYWEVIHERHGSRLYRNLNGLQKVLAEYLKTSIDSIKRDLILLRARLGKNWPTDS